MSEKIERRAPSGKDDEPRAGEIRARIETLRWIEEELSAARRALERELEGLPPRLELPDYRHELGREPPPKDAAPADVALGNAKRVGLFLAASIQKGANRKELAALALAAAGPPPPPEREPYRYKSASMRVERLKVIAKGEPTQLARALEVMLPELARIEPLFGKVDLGQARNIVQGIASAWQALGALCVLSGAFDTPVLPQPDRWGTPGKFMDAAKDAGERLRKAIDNQDVRDTAAAAGVDRATAKKLLKECIPVGYPEAPQIGLKKARRGPRKSR